ncbi:hypothetical protein COV58_04090 [Candidatus Roizmanbacteria bacterium CG11_big_fil_rev_8_21_14_0_20_36_8]|uniref:FCP1 homology domain-containing protein n=2 Tax=Candidatus Roizmaniibacteriota TaxID=1752723 RepID=A0A2M6IT93_9BACT|nr:MAG: hypothetical protein COV58_04090 [Candidatus Roizmanbacteria bacterium CG11_big_fil_rev_8_21_14_0_20_36_8]PIZ65445.1 MAG: hypothetical protein COY14_02415 [Candidatus Roizmanbacteria bacterium CG_4_10_14_0_2_um_filter_36_9]
MKQQININKPLKIGFDLDGVLLYNPARVFRPITLAVKYLINPEKVCKTHFYYPKTTLEQLIWRLVHLSSFKMAKGLDEIKQLVEDGKIEAYIVTSRYDCLKGDFTWWIKRMNAKRYFKGVFHNKNNMQPHLFKVKKLKELKLDYFVEDNWDIVSNITKQTNTTGLWITNNLDKGISYPHKFMSLKDAVNFIKQLKH